MGGGVSNRAAVTIDEVAAEAGVSRSTVSRVINGAAGVSSAAETKVQRAIDKLGYVPSRAARSLAMRQNNAIALVVPSSTGNFFGDPYFAVLIDAIYERVARAGATLTLVIAPHEHDEDTVRSLVGGDVDGVVFVSPYANDDLVDEVGAAIPTVIAGRRQRPHPRDYYIESDGVDGARVACEHLISRGRRLLATITGRLGSSQGIDRLSGFRQALSAAGLTPVGVEDGDFTHEGAVSAMRRILETGTVPDGIFAASDLMARAVLGVLETDGLRVPDDVAVVGYDDAAIASRTTPPLTTMRQPAREQGHLMVDVLLELLAGGEPERFTRLQTELVIRGST